MVNEDRAETEDQLVTINRCGNVIKGGGGRVKSWRLSVIETSVALRLKYY